MDRDEIAIYKILAQAYRPGMKVKEFRQEIMQAARKQKNNRVRNKMLQAIPHLSNADLEELLIGMSLHSAELDKQIQF